MTTNFDMEKIRAARATNYTRTFGHNYFVSQKPPLQGTSDLDGFMKLKLESERNEVKAVAVAVDKVQKSVVARVAYRMKAPGQGPVENDLMWWLWMNANGTTVERRMEFVDPAATKKLQNRMAASASAGAN
ncbi:hypothetical protein P171DRAFT_507374 [Karstenula rhodostoma CBS 690.94]|uniref:Uncharacterized protein n=1 Tax=Karstenula rhodostoma CBS 690.94 TaxID=1392251 RepID=A0A9P4UGK9_9PLEO|nr:hypothetical protein P171DRAFT_507374 [Karstenula rhodostoma CBS 690.94]